MVAISILSIVLATTTASFVANLRKNFDAQLKFEAILAAQHVLDELRFRDVTTLTTPFSENVTLNNRTYVVAISYCKIASFCPTEESRQIVADVSYKGRALYETDTVYSKF